MARRSPRKHNTAKPSANDVHTPRKRNASEIAQGSAGSEAASGGHITATDQSPEKRRILADGTTVGLNNAGQASAIGSDHGQHITYYSNANMQQSHGIASSALHQTADGPDDAAQQNYLSGHNQAIAQLPATASNVQTILPGVNAAPLHPAFLNLTNARPQMRVTFQPVVNNGAQVVQMPGLGIGQNQPSFSTVSNMPQRPPPLPFIQPNANQARQTVTPPRPFNGQNQVPALFNNAPQVRSALSSGPIHHGAAMPARNGPGIIPATNAANNRGQPTLSDLVHAISRHPGFYPAPTTARWGRRDLYRIRGAALSKVRHPQRYVVGDNFRPVFSLMEAFTSQPDLLLALVPYLSLPSILHLYAMDKKFHYLFNANYTAYITAIARVLAPDAFEVYPWIYYQSLCLRDPHARKRGQIGFRISASGAAAAGTIDDIRTIPSLAWLQMCVWRENVCTDILVQLAAKGIRCPKHTVDALKRLWFLMDCPLNEIRLSLMRSEYFTDKTLMKLTCFFIKLDLHFTDPYCQLINTTAPIGPMQAMQGAVIGCEMREYMLAERHLTTLWRVLHGWCPDNKAPALPITIFDMLRLWAKHKWIPDQDTPEEIREMTAFGLQYWELGTTRLERVGLSFDLAARLTEDQRNAIADVAGWTNRLLGPDELVMREAVRRELSLHKDWVYYMTYGLQDPRGRPYPVYTEEQMNYALTHGTDLGL